jgi:Homeodomain-like domain
MKKWVVRLEPEERDRLSELVGKGKAAAYKIRHANVLLAVDESGAGPGLADEPVAHTLGIAVRSIESLRRRFVEEGLDAALGRKKRERPSIEPMFDGRKEAKLIAVACGPRPKGRARWTLQLLADRVVELKIVEHCSRETIRRTLQKTS